MRHLFLILLPILLVLGCNSDDDDQPPLTTNTFTAQKGDDPWEGTIDLKLTTDDTLTFLAIGEGLDNGVLVVKVKFKGVGTYAVEKEKALYYNTLGGDAIVEEYTLQEPEKATFVVESYHEANGTLTGTFAFELTPEAQGGKSIEYFMRITEGRFRGSIKKDVTQ